MLSSQAVYTHNSRNNGLLRYYDCINRTAVVVVVVVVVIVAVAAVVVVVVVVVAAVVVVVVPVVVVLVVVAAVVVVVVVAITANNEETSNINKNRIHKPVSFSGRLGGSVCRLSQGRVLNANRWAFKIGVR